jgi:hypothetical protein
MKLLFIVSRGEPELYRDLGRKFADEAAEVILDRRVGERRRQRLSYPAERRRADRRARPSIDEDLGIIGWAIVRTP